MVHEISLTCPCGGNRVVSGRWKLSYPAIGSAQCDKCGGVITVWSGSNNKIHETMLDAMASDRHDVSLIDHCCLCGQPEDAGITCGHDIRACRPCYLECKELGIHIRDAVRDPARLERLRVKRAS
jgi:hypothetical protein